MTSYRPFGTTKVVFPDDYPILSRKVECDLNGSRLSALEAKNDPMTLAFLEP